MGISIMKFAVAALVAIAQAGVPPSSGLGHPIIPATREDFDNAKGVWGGDWAKYRAAHPNDQDCSISESDNWKGAQQCSQSWECRGARLAREADGAPDMTVARELHFQTKLQDLPLTAEPPIDSCKRVENVAVIMVFYDTLIYLS